MAINNTLSSIYAPMSQSTSALPKKTTQGVLSPSAQNLLVQKPVTLTAAPQTTPKPAPVQSTYAAAPTYQSSTPVKGLITPDTSSLNKQLGDIQSGLVALQGNLNKPLAGTNPNFYQNVVGELAQSGDRNQAIADRAAAIGETAGREYARIGQEGARAETGYLTTGTTPVAQGNAAVTAQTTAAQQQAIAAGEQAALAGNAQALTAQGQTQSALNQAAGLAQPQVTAFGQTSFNPLNGQFAGGGSLPPEVMRQYAQMAASGQIAAVPSFITSNPVLNAQLNAAAQQINPAYNPITSGAQGQVLASLPQMQAANNAAEGIKGKIISYLQANPTLNQNTLAVGNLAQQWLQGKQLSDPKYQTLFNYLNEYTNTLTPILGVGGDSTNLKTEIAQGFINAAASGQSISEVLNNISQLAEGKIQDLQAGALGGGVVSNPQTQSTNVSNNSGWGWNP